MLDRLFDILLPLKSIAQELRHIRRLYEMELGERVPPLILPSQAPSRYDTEVIVEGLEKPTSALNRIKEKLFPQEVDDDDFNDMWLDSRSERASPLEQFDKGDPTDPTGSSRE